MGVQSAAVRCITVHADLESLRGVAGDLRPE